jgi:predicted PurR-regulated permease PerM
MSLVKNDLGFRVVKVFDIGYITILTFVFGILVARLFDFIYSKYEKLVGKSRQPNILILLLELAVMMWLVGVSTYLTRNIIELIPSPFDGIAGLVHKNVKELGGAGVFTFIVLSFTNSIGTKIGELNTLLKNIF